MIRTARSDDAPRIHELHTASGHDAAEVRSSHVDIPVVVMEYEPG